MPGITRMMALHPLHRMCSIGRTLPRPIRAPVHKTFMAGQGWSGLGQGVRIVRKQIKWQPVPLLDSGSTRNDTSLTDCLVGQVVLLSEISGINRKP